MISALDRSTPPAAGPFQLVPLPEYTTHQLSNGMPVHLLPFGSLEIAEVQTIFFAGKNYQPKIGVAGYMSRNMLEGTAQHNSLEIAQMLDGQGAWLNHLLGEQSLSFRLATLTDRIPRILPLLPEVVFSPSFPASEFESMKDRSLQKLKVNEERTGYVASREFKQLLFGSGHIYGAQLGIPELEALKLEELIAYHEQALLPASCQLSVVGKFDQSQVLDWLEGAFATYQPQTKTTLQPKEMGSALQTTGRHTIEKAGMQASLRLGYLSVNRSHPDYYALMVLNTLFGGFFGSRLMKNIREEKGYTYGIYSSLVANQHAGFWVIQTDVGNEYVEATISEVKKEMNRLKEERVSEEELKLVKNYLLGKSLSQRESPFQIGDFLRFSIAQGISFAEIDRKFEVIQQITPEMLQYLAQQYLKPDDMLELVVGQPEK
ncbi:MAG: pitrilysin family protein [Bacteroidota bacterium]